MDKNHVVYNGRLYQKSHFRVFVYGQNDTKRLVNSWDEYQEAVNTGMWFSTKDAVTEKKLKK